MNPLALPDETVSPPMPSNRLAEALAQARDDLLAERLPKGHWQGELSSSALSTATAVSALALVHRHAGGQEAAGVAAQSSLLSGGIAWLAAQQNPDGGWGDTDRSRSNISTTMLVRAAFELAGACPRHLQLVTGAEDYLQRAGGVEAIKRRYGNDKTFAVPILTNAALAGLVHWRHVSALPFEAACIPQRWLRFARLPVVSYAVPALVAIGQAKFFHDRTRNPVLALVRSRCVEPSLRALERMQPASGGYLEATPLTSFVVMSLAATGRASHPVVQRGVEFLRTSVRPDGSWPIDTNLATWGTTLAINALAAAGQPLEHAVNLDWLLACQHRQRHPFTGADPGGWGWTDLSGAVPDADDTPGALLALCRLLAEFPQRADEIHAAARAGVRWLLDLQNGDGGWPTFCRGWGKLPFDRSGADLTAHAIRAILAWRSVWRESSATHGGAAAAEVAQLVRHSALSLRRGWRFLKRQQRSDGSWLPLWFGNQFHPTEDNPVYGTARVLLAYAALAEQLPAAAWPAAAVRGVEWLVGAQNRDGGWGAAATADEVHAPPREGVWQSSVEETSLAVEALASLPALPAAGQAALKQGLEWLTTAVLAGEHRVASPIGFYFAKLWYYERLYPRTFAVAALGQAWRRCQQTPVGPA